MGDPLSGEPAEGTTIGDMAFSRFEGGAQKLQVKARDSRQQEGGAWHYQGVEVTFPFVARGRESSATITSDECLYDPDREEALFSGNVHVVTDDGFELTTESLEYLGSEGRVRSEVDVQFERGASKGRSSSPRCGCGPRTRMEDRPPRSSPGALEGRGRPAS